MCGVFPCVCEGSERRTRFIKRQVESASLNTAPAGTSQESQGGRANRDETDILPRESEPAEEAVTSARLDSSAGGDDHD